MISLLTAAGIGRTEIDASVDDPDVNATVPPEDVQAPLPPVPLCAILSSVTPQVFAAVVKSVAVVIVGAAEAVPEAETVWDTAEVAEQVTSPLSELDALELNLT